MGQPMMRPAQPMMAVPNPNPMSMRPAQPMMNPAPAPFGMMGAPPMQQRGYPMQQANPMGMPYGQPAAPQPQPNFLAQVNPAAQRGYLGVGNPRANPSPFSNPNPLQSGAFDTLMMGNQPKKDHKVYKPTSAAYAAKKTANDGLKIDLSNWMTK